MTKEELMQLPVEKLAGKFFDLEKEVEMLRFTSKIDHESAERYKDIIKSISITPEAFNK
ncbi:MAG: hypothetical protein LBV72_00405 [Tannerella sp.]|jgi:hypothetical protein|nr:hypothetical protein [Tannerella sp.]